MLLLLGRNWLADERRRIERGEWTPPAQRAAERRAKGVTLAEYGPTWIEQRTKGGEPLKPRTRSHYTKIFDEHIKQAALGKIPLGNITPEAVRDWHSSTLPDKPTYRAHAYGLLHAMLSTAVTDLELEVVGKGIINDYTYRQNPLVRFLERLVIF